MRKSLPNDLSSYESYCLKAWVATRYDVRRFESRRCSDREDSETRCLRLSGGNERSERPGRDAQ